MRILFAIVMICGTSFVLLIALLSVVRDMLKITNRHAPSELNKHAVGREEAALSAKASEEFR